MISIERLSQRNQSDSLRLHSETMEASRLEIRTDVKKLIEKLNAESDGEEILYRPDEWKAYMLLEICRTMPHVCGPTSSGNYTVLYPAVVAANHPSLRHQQLNFEHQLTAYDPDSIPRDRIIGAVIDTVFPELESEDWEPETAEDALAVAVTSVLWKQAEGVSQFLADHLGGKKTYAVSIEMVSPLDHLGIYVPSTRECFYLLDPELPEEILFAISEDEETGGLMLGKTEAGEQLAWAYGYKNGVVSFRGIGVVEYPADKTAKISRIEASRIKKAKKKKPGKVLPISALTEKQHETKSGDSKYHIGDNYTFTSTGKSGTVHAFHRKGMFANLIATTETPVMEVRLSENGKPIYLRGQ